MLILTETKWAFGRITQAIQKYSKKFYVDILDWSSGLPTEKVLSGYDLIYMTVWDAARKFELTHPHLADKMIFSGHGLVDFIKMKLASTDNIPITEEQINNFDIDPALTEWLKQRKAGFSVVSHELQNIFTKKLDMIPDEHVYLTQCGADTGFFEPLVPAKENTSSDPLRVIYSLPLKAGPGDRGQGYDAKRKWMVENIREKLQKNPKYENRVEFIYPPDFLSLDKMKEFYHQGDVWLCVSHSEGNPLGAFEAGASGLTVVTTNVGEMAHFIKDGENGFLIDNKNTEQIENDIVDRLMKLVDDRQLLTKMKQNLTQTVQNEWSWENKMKQWDDFFVQCVEQITE